MDLQVSNVVEEIFHLEICQPLMQNYPMLVQHENVWDLIDFLSQHHKLFYCCHVGLQTCHTHTIIYLTCHSTVDL